ncbi:S-layer homology domain-containing protein [Peptoniphilus hominis (ex Hitch et al. 2025)]|uniref:S-layer homology domain-containing protein n=1 Tax=Peptoniphilus hominis (ex Hitch et al. 2025) TaxID=3133174 RepID=A0ABV1CEJ9_9FIRM
MKNKKLLSLLLAGVMITAIPFNVFADEPQEETAELKKVEETVVKESEKVVEPELELSESAVPTPVGAPVTKQYKVTFNPDNGKDSTFVFVEDGKNADEPTPPTKDGFDFVEWQKDGVKFEFTTPITADITLKAVWKAKTPTPVTEKFTVKFNSDGGSIVPDQTIDKGSMATNPADPTKDGYIFKGWYDGGVEFKFKTTPVTENKNLIARWEAKPIAPVVKVLSISERYYDNGRFYGKVTADGIGIKGATVKLYDYDGSYTGKYVVTDENGYFDIYVGDYYYGYYNGKYYGDYYEGYYRYDSNKGKYYYYNSYNERVYVDYTPYGYGYYGRYYDGRYYNGRYYDGKYYGGYLLATKDDFTTSAKYELYGRYWDGYYNGYKYDKYYYDRYDKKVYPTDISRTNYSTSGYLKGYYNRTVYVYDNGVYLGSDVIDSNGYFKVTWNSPYVSTDRTLDYYVNGDKTTTNDSGYSIIPTVNALSAGAKFVRGNAGANATVTVYDASGVKLGNTTAGNTGIYNVTLNRELRAGETIKVEAKETGKIARSTDYKIGGVTVSTEKVNQPSYIAGFPDGTFKPSNQVTRAEAVRMFVKLVNNGAELPKNPTTSFKDANNAWYSDEINYAVAKGFIKGYSDGTFKPNQAITRAEFAQMISAFVKNGYPGTGSFKDVKGHWASDAISALYGNKNIKGYGDGTFKPDQKLTRAEAVTILNSVFGRNTKSNSFANVSEAGLRRFSDVSKSHWAYYEILDASNGHNAAKIEGMDQVSIWQ